MKKKFLLALICFSLQASISYAATHVKVVAINEFRTEHPSKTFNVKVLDTVTLGKYELFPNTQLNCNVLQTVDPKRGKRNASFYVQPTSYITNGIYYPIETEMYGKYTKTVLSKEELKKIPPFEVIKNTGVLVGSFFIKGLSIGVSMVEGFVKNEKDNRFKSGVVKAYEDSPLSYIEEGTELDIKPGDDFYFVFKTAEDDAPNYTYTPAAE